LEDARDRAGSREERYGEREDEDVPLVGLFLLLAHCSGMQTGGTDEDLV
jgi:hypothetical protein